MDQNLKAALEDHPDWIDPFSAGALENALDTALAGYLINEEGPLLARLLSERGTSLEWMMDGLASRVYQRVYKLVETEVELMIESGIYANRTTG